MDSHNLILLQIGFSILVSCPDRSSLPRLLQSTAHAPSMPSLLSKVHAPSMPSLLGKASSAAVVCARRVSRATRRLPRTARRVLQRARRLRRDFSQLVPTTDDHHQQKASDDADEELGGGEEEEDGGLWRRTVLMGERCKPLDFPGAIHYDSSGRLLPAAPSPRSSGKQAAGALRLCRSACDVDEAATARSKAWLQAKHV